MDSLLEEENEDQIITDDMPNNDQNKSSSNSEPPMIDLFINGASNLKTLIFMWKAQSSSFVFNFTKDMIYSATRNRNNTITISLEIPEKNMLKYYFDTERLAGPDASEKDKANICVIGAVQTEQFEEKLKLCGKGINFTLTIWQDDSNLYFKQVGPETGTLVIPMKISEVQQYNLPPMPTQTIVRILTSDFVAAIKSAIPDSVDKINFIPFVDGLHLTTLGSVGQIVGHVPFGNCSIKFGENNKKDDAVRNFIKTRFDKDKSKDRSKIVIKKTINPHSIVVDAAEIKSFARLSSVSPDSSIIKIYYNLNKRVIMLEGLVGTFGIYRIYLQNKKTILK